MSTPTQVWPPLHLDATESAKPKRCTNSGIRTGPDGYHTWQRGTNCSDHMLIVRDMVSNLKMGHSQYVRDCKLVNGVISCDLEDFSGGTRLELDSKLRPIVLDYQMEYEDDSLTNKVHMFY